MSTWEEKGTRSMGGKLALWVFYTFCGYFIWAMAHCVWLMSAIQTEPVLGPNGEPGSATEKWLIRALTGRRLAYSWEYLPGTLGLAKACLPPLTLRPKTRSQARM
nr:membrane protein [Salmonella sp. NCTC 7297]